MNENAVVANNSNFSSDLTTKEYKIILNITEKAFAGLSRQGMLCHQGICELCDDAISAALPGQKAQICIALAPDSDKNYIQLAVADWGHRHESNGTNQRVATRKHADQQQPLKRTRLWS